MRKTGLQIKKAIINQLKQKDCSLREIQTKVNTNHITIISHCKELEYFGFVELRRLSENKRNGRPYTLVKITEQGKKLQ